MTRDGAARLRRREFRPCVLPPAISYCASGVGLRCARSRMPCASARRSAGPAAISGNPRPLSTTTLPRIKGWPTPQKPAQKFRMLPMRVGVIQKKVSMPGHQVHFGAEFRHIEIMDDVDRAEQEFRRLVDRQMQVAAEHHEHCPASGGREDSGPRGCWRRRSACRRSPSRPSLPGSRKLHCHCWPTTSTVVVPGGGLMKLFHTTSPGASMAATPSAVPAMSQNSSFLLSG